MNQNNPNNKLIAKNTIFLYFRMIVMMAISLFTSREVLRVLGVSDFGIYGVIGGVIVLFSFFQTALTSSSQRFFSFEIGKGDDGNLSRSFSSSLVLHFVLALTILILSETIGLWILYDFLNIPEDRFDAAIILFHFVILTFVTNVLRTPFNSAIIAHEKMSFYAYVSVIEAMLKLSIVYCLYVSPIDRLVAYGILLFSVAVCVILIYYFYVRINFKDCHIKLIWDWQYMKSMVYFSGWSLLGGVSNVSAQQGCNVLLNVYAGVSVNASFGIANQVSQAIYQMSSNLQNAFSPQIVKQFSSGNTGEMYKLIYRSSLLSFYMMLIIALPIIFKMDLILDTWLSNVPAYASSFSIFMIVYLMIDTLQGPLVTLVHATGIIKVYYIWLSIMISMCFPFAWWALCFGLDPNIVIIARVVINFITYVTLIVYLSHLTKMSIMGYISNVVKRCTSVLILSSMLLYLYYLLLSDTIYENLIFLFISVVTIFFVVLCVGFNNADRQLIVKLFLSKIQK